MREANIWTVAVGLLLIMAAVMMFAWAADSASQAAITVHNYQSEVIR